MCSESVEGLGGGGSEAKRSEDIVDPDTGNNQVDGGGGEEVVKKEVVQEWSTSEESLKPGEDKSTKPHLSPSTPSLSSTGKRKKKPKELYDELYCGFRKTKTMTKQPSLSKSKPAVSDHAVKFTRCKRAKTAINGLQIPGKVKTPIMIRAEEIQSSLGSEFPSFVKQLVRSHVSSCFWMGLPGPFCKLHLPRKDTRVILEDESGEQSQVKFIAENPGLSAGWRNFAAGHKLLEGDAMVFQLVGPDKFKVYMVRANDLTEVDGALSLLNLEAHTKQNDTEKDDAENSEIALNNKRKRQKPLPLAAVKKKTTGLPKSVERLENDSEEIGSAVLVGPKLSCSTVHFRDIKSFEDFHILVNGLCVDSEIAQHIRVKYYDLCRSKNAYIHACLLRGLNSKLVAGIICETVNIANALRACKLTTSRDEFEIWEKTLKSLELMGMNVGFLRDRLRHFVTLAFESEDALDTRRYIEAKTGKVRAENEIRNLEIKLVELKAASEKFGENIEALKSKAESHEHKFQEEVDLPW